MHVVLTSKKLAFYLIALILVFIILSAIIPQKNFAEERIIDWRKLLGDNYKVIEILQLDRIYYNPVFFLVLGLFAINLTAVNINRFKTVYKIERTVLRAKHLGSIIFHLSLLVIILGVILNYLYKYNGVFAVTEKQTVDDSPSSYFQLLRGPLYSGLSDRFSLTLESFDSEYRANDATTEAANIHIINKSDHSEFRAALMTNRPFKWQNLEFHYGLISGYSPRVVLSDTSGNIHLESFVRLATRKMDGRLSYRDYILLPRENLKIDIDVSPGTYISELPNFTIMVEKADRIIYQGTIGISEIVSFDGYNLTIDECRRWCYIDVVESPFLGMVFAGFWSGLAGLLMGFIARIKVKQGN